MGVYIIAEAGVNHNGSLDFAFRLCDAAKAAGADCVKFQTWQTDKIATRRTVKADYQSRNTGDADESQFDMLRKLELGYEDFARIQTYCRQIGIDFLSTPDEQWSLRFLVDELGMPLVKVGSGEVTNIPYLRQIAACRRPVILSTGMATLAQVARAYDTLKEGGCPELTLLHCTTNYPCPYGEVNLRAMETLREAFHCPVGYSDHTLGIEVPVAAVALGAQVIEKHFTLDCSMEGPDHRASLDLAALAQMVRAIRNIEQALGDGVKRPNASELAIAPVVRKSIVAACTIAAGDTFSPDNLTVKRANGGLSAELWDVVIGRKASRSYQIDEPIV